MKKSLVSGLALSLITVSSYGNATTPPETKPVHLSSDVFLSHPKHTFEIEIGALLLQPTGSNLHYAAEAIPLPVESPHWKIHDINTDYHFGFDLGLRGLFHGTNTSLTLNWEHFHGVDSASKDVSSENMIGPFFEIGPDASAYKQAHGKAKFHFDEVSLDYGICINFGNRLQTNLFSGIGFIHLHQSIFSKFSDDSGTAVRTISVPSTFTGAGPELGLDLSYRIVKGFHFVGEAAAALFVGTQKNHTTYKSNSPLFAGSPAANVQTTNTYKKTQVVPGIEGKLGLSYVFSFQQHYAIKIEAGYQAQVYLNALRSVDIGSEVVTPPVTPDVVGVFARTFQNTLNNFALAGPYLTVDFGF